MKWVERAALREPKHGTFHEYNKYKCRCDLCKKAGIEHAAKYRAKYPDRHRTAVKKSQQRIVKLVRQSKEVPCADCGIQYPHYVMQYDHLGDKSFAISDRKTRARGIDVVIGEIKKCDVVCANCHHVRTYNRRIENQQGVAA